jgi:hypothetical protein
MISFVKKKWLPGICNLNQLVWKIRKKLLQQVTACKVLQALMFMRDIQVRRYFAKKEIFVLFYLPDAQPFIIVDIMLIK